MNTPAPPKPHPDTPTSQPAIHPDSAPNGVPKGAEDADAKGAPNSDRQDSETAAKP